MAGGGKGGKLSFNVGGTQYTQEQANKEMTALGGVLKDYDSDAIINYGSIANIENLGGEEKQTILDRITQIAETAENPRVKQAANRYLQFAEARGWFQTEKPKALPTAPEGMPETAMQSVIDAGGKTVEFANGRKYKFDSGTNKIVEIDAQPKTGLAGAGKPGEAQAAEINPKVKTDSQNMTIRELAKMAYDGMGPEQAVEYMKTHRMVPEDGQIIDFESFKNAWKNVKKADKWTADQFVRAWKAYSNYANRAIEATLNLRIPGTSGLRK